MLTEPCDTLSIVAVTLPLCLHAQTAPAAPKPTERPTADQLAKLKSGPPLPYKVVPNWPALPKGHNLGEASGVDVDRQGNVWVFNRGHWPIMQFDRAGKLLQSWSEDTVRLKSAARTSRRSRRIHLVRGCGRACGVQVQPGGGGS